MTSTVGCKSVASRRNVEVQHSIDDIVELVRTHPRENQDLQLDEQSITSFRGHYSNAMYQVSTVLMPYVGPDMMIGLHILYPVHVFAAATKKPLYTVLTACA